jgi:glycerophosphoryl diester phosphodiesterase
VNNRRTRSGDTHADRGRIRYNRVATMADPTPIRPLAGGGLGGDGSRLLCIGHAGASARARANSLESFALAARLGADVLEFDVRLCRGRLLLAHTILDARRPGCLAVDDALRWLAREVDAQLLVDLKSPGIEDAVTAGLRRHGLAERAVITSQSRALLRRVREVEPRIRVAISVAGIVSRRIQRWDEWRHEVVAEVRERRYGAVMVHRRLVDAALVERVHDAGAELHAWTVSVRSDIAALAPLGIDGIVTTDPALVAA